MNYKTRLVIASCLPVIALVAAALTFGLMYFQKSLYAEKQGNLRSTALAALTLYMSHGYGDFARKSDGNIWRGMNFNISEETDMVDDLTRQTDVNITFFFGDTAVMTSMQDTAGNRLIGMKAAPEVIEHTLGEGAHLWFKEILIGHTQCQAYVIPIRQESNNDIVGAIMASQSAAGFRATIRNYIASDLASSFVIMFLAIGYICLFAGRFSKEFSDVQKKSREDQLTGLYNKMSFESAAHSALSTRTESEIVALFIIDFDNFKHVNDSYGHQAGDEALKGFGEILKHAFRSSDIIGRVGGDEFMVLMTHMNADGLPRVEKIASDIRERLSKLTVSEVNGFSCSIGIATDTIGYDFALLYTIADTALYEAKKRGKDCFVRMDANNL